MDPPRPNYNLAPTQAALVLFGDESGIRWRPMSWGLVPRWSKDSSRASSLINARSETVTEKPSFRGLVKSHRCVVPMDGFYEWERSDPKNKVPFFCSRSDGKLLLAAGLWTDSPAHPESPTFCILTRDSGSDLVGVHDRSPVHLCSEDAIRWLCDRSAPLELTSVELNPRLSIRRVHKKVNSVRNNGPDLLAECDDGAPVPESQRDTLF